MAADELALRPWQAREIVEHALTAKRAILAEPRTGKTLATRRSLLAARTGGFSGDLLVCCPLAVGPMWVRQLNEDGWTVLALYKGEMVERAFALGQLSRTAQRGNFAVVLNEDVGDPLFDQLVATGFTFVVVDESHHMRGISSNRGRALRQLCWNAKWVRLLTGTPAPKHYGNLWGQMVALDRDAWGRSYHRDFKEKYLEYDPEYPSIITGTKNEDALQRKLLQFATFVRREDVFGPDQYDYQVEWLDLPADALASYRRLAKEFVLENPDVSARHVLTRITRLQQLASGYLPTLNELDEPILKTMHTAKVDAVLNTIESIALCDMKAVLYHRFKWEGQHYLNEARKRMPDLPIFPIQSNIKIVERDANALNFQTTKGAALVIAQTRTGGIGIDLSEADYVLRASQSFIPDDEKQAVVRAFKPGCPRIVIDYRMRNTVDGFIAETLKIGHDMDSAVMHADRESMFYGKIVRPKQSQV